MDRGLRTSGYTLVELMAVLLLLGLAVTIVVLNIRPLIPKYRFRAEARELGHILQYARERAAVMRQDTYVRIDLGEQRYEALVPAPPGEETTGAVEAAPKWLTTLRRRLPDDVRVRDVVLGTSRRVGEGTALIHFTPYPAGIVLVHLAGDPDRRLTIEFNSLTGDLRFVDGFEELPEPLDDVGG